MKNRQVKRLSIYEEFSVEMDLFSLDTNFPDWIFDFREHHLSKINSKLVKFCRKLKENRVNFKILFPIQIHDKWKFADIYIPKKKTVIMVTTTPHSPAYLTQRANFFNEWFKVYELDGYEGEHALGEIIANLK